MKKIRCDLGIIELGDKAYISDPCYSIGTWCQALVDNLKPGRYLCYMYKTDFGPGGFGGIRVTDLWVVHEDNKHAYPTKILDKNICIGVDSGSAGIYDKDYYEKYHVPNLDDDWYDRQFDLRYYYDTEGKKYIEPYPEYDSNFNIINWVKSGQERRDGIALDGKCVISFSGFGDGSYGLYARRNKDNQIIGLRLKFIWNGEDE